MALVAATFYQNHDRGNGGHPAAYPVADGVQIYAGSLVGLDQSDGFLKPWANATATDLDFKGLAQQSVLGDATPAAGLPVPECTVEEGGLVLERVAIAGLDAQDKVGNKVYASDENTFTLTPTAGSDAVGTVKRFWGVDQGDIELYTPNEYLDQ
jgi:hypothetical protein